LLEVVEDQWEVHLLQSELEVKEEVLLESMEQEVLPHLQIVAAEVAELTIFHLVAQVHTV
jgi:hypothetical protein